MKQVAGFFSFNYMGCLDHGMKREGNMKNSGMAIASHGHDLTVLGSALSLGFNRFKETKQPRGQRKLGQFAGQRATA